MDKHTIVLLIGLALSICGAIMAFYDKYYRSEWWRSKQPQAPMNANASERLARFQGLVVLLMGLAFLYVALSR